MKRAFLFPGQGAQQVGMGKDLYEAFDAARVVFDAANQVTGLPLKKLCFEGPSEELSRTDIAQPAIFTVSAALLACLDSLLDRDKAAAIRPAFMAGLSLGEYTALYAADMIDFADALKLVARRGSAMQAAATAVPSGMVIVMGLDETKANELCKAAGNAQALTCANFNCPGQIVLSGRIDACKRAVAMAKDFGATVAMPLNVAGAFHCPIMQPAADDLGKALESVSFRLPRPKAMSSDRGGPARPEWGQEFGAEGCKVIANVDGRCYEGLAEVPGKLMAQLTGSTRWQQSMEAMLAQGVTKFYEIGPGRVLAGLMRRINRKAEIVSINSRKSLEELASSIQ